MRIGLPSILFIIGFFMLFISTAGCQTFHTGLTDEQVVRRVNQRFHTAMSAADVHNKLCVMRLDEIRTWSEDDQEDGIAAGDIGAVVWPERFLFNGIMAYYGRDMLLFRFGGDDALDDVIWRPFGWNESAGDRVVINLNQSEDTP